ncbi:multidrug resistance secretion protein [Klebsiella pneumoniae]|uniref:Multidrug resistance secretion protein n=1 Tax=Klebsiella pneumoniae TaxID=573 RepID=A0A378BW50_KLEPN|nr:multidrug resistance secretion protein [Klebsiella pneumoniae]
MSANAESQTPQQPGSKKGKRKGALLLLTLLFIIIAVAYGIYWFLVLRHYEEDRRCLRGRESGTNYGSGRGQRDQSLG